MKKTLSSALLVAAAFAALPAAAQTGPAAGTVQVNGTVAAKCYALQPIAGTISLGELAKDDGTIDEAFSKATGGKSTMFTVRCNGSNPLLSVRALPLVNNAVTETANGYTNKVHYTATLDATRAQGGKTSVAAPSRETAPATARVDGRLAAEANNMLLTISSGQTESSTAILDAGAYQGSVSVTISAPL